MGVPAARGCYFMMFWSLTTAEYGECSKSRARLVSCAQKMSLPCLTPFASSRACCFCLDVFVIHPHTTYVHKQMHLQRAAAG